jgi:signal transduction histidine kinase
MAAHILLQSKALDAQHLDFAASIKRNVSTMDAMIKDLLEYASGELGRKIPIKPKAANMGSICQASLDEVQSAYPDMIFNLEVSGNLDGFFDAARFQQVLSNLLNNAAKYCQPGTPITLSARRESETIIVQVKNFGTPIPPESLQVIFNPLVQLSDIGQNSNSHLSTSLGLGLFIAREIVEGHNGTIEATSTEPDGTIFTVQLPLN